VSTCSSVGEDGVLDHLLGDGGAALGKPHVRDVDKQGARDGPDLDAMMSVKVGVLNGDNRILDIGRNLIECHARALDIAVAEVVEQYLAGAVVKLNRLVDADLRERGQIGQGERCRPQKKDAQEDKTNTERVQQRFELVLFYPPPRRAGVAGCMLAHWLILS
jgi:hypothetical protein